MKIKYKDLEVELDVDEFLDLVTKLKAKRAVITYKIESPEKKEKEEKIYASFVISGPPFEEFERGILNRYKDLGFNCIAYEKLSPEVSQIALRESLSSFSYYVFSRDGKYFFVPGGRIRNWWSKYKCPKKVSKSALKSALYGARGRIDTIKDIAVQIAGLVRRGEIEEALKKFKNLMSQPPYYGKIGINHEVIKGGELFIFDFMVKMIKKGIEVRTISHRKETKVLEEAPEPPEVLKELMEAQRDI